MGTFILNEIMLLIVGLGIAFLMNLMMPSLDKKLNHFKQDIENQITEIFNIFSQACSMHNDHLNIKFDSLLLNIKKQNHLLLEMLKSLCTKRKFILSLF